MKKAIVTVDTNGALVANARDSMEAAAARWGAPLVVIERLESRLSAPSMKTRAFSFTDADRILVIDADATISALAPSPFDEAAADRLGVVRNPDRNGEPHEWDKLSRAIENPGAGFEGPVPAEALTHGVLPRPDNYFNSGFILAAREHHGAIFDLAADLCRGNAGLAWQDQTPFNYAARALARDSIALMDETWNYISPMRLPGEWKRMQKHVYHLAGCPARLKLLPLIEWRADGAVLSGSDALYRSDVAAWGASEL